MRAGVPASDPDRGGHGGVRRASGRGWRTSTSATGSVSTAPRRPTSAPTWVTATTGGWCSPAGTVLVDRTDRVGRGPQRLPVRERVRHHRRGQREPHRLPLRPVWRLRPIPDRLELREGRRARLFDGHGGPRPRRARPRSGGQHPLRLRACRSCGTPAPDRSVPAAWSCGRPGEVYLLSTWDEGVPDEIPHDHLFGITWNPMNFVALLKGIAADAAPRRVGTDAMSPLFAQLLPMAFPDAEIVDGSRRAAIGPAHQDRRGGRRHPLRHRGGRVGHGRRRGRAAARRERARPDRRVHGRHGLAAVSPRRRPRTSSASPRPAGSSRPGRRPRSQAGDLVSFDAGVVADGYAGEVGRTWPVGLDGARPRRREPSTAATTSCGRGCSTPAGPAPSAPASSTPTGRPVSRCR